MATDTEERVKPGCNDDLGQIQEWGYAPSEFDRGPQF